VEWRVEDTRGEGGGGEEEGVMGREDERKKRGVIVNLGE